MTMIRRFKTGVSRYQPSFLPPCLEDYVSLDNPVRAIEAYVATLDVVKLGFRVAGSDGGAGQPPYGPRDLLKLYLYGYLHGIRSSRRLAREARRNVEVMWLLSELKPEHRTIANFRKENWAALKAANRDFVLVARRGEWSLMALCYNFSRVLTIVGLDKLIAYFANRAIGRLFYVFSVLLLPPGGAPERSWRAFGPRSAPRLDSVTFTPASPP